MAHQTSGQLDFADSLLGNNQKLNQRLDKINRLVDWKPLEARLSRIPVEQTYRILVTNTVFMGSRNKNYKSQERIVEGHGCVMPIVQEYVALCVFTSKIFKKCLYGQNPLTSGRSSTHLQGFPLVVGGSAPARLCVSPYYFDSKNDGAGGRRKF
jgi:hypothetical protein